LEIGATTGLSKLVELNEEIRKRKRAETARKKRKRIKLIQEQRAVEEQPEDFIIKPPPKRFASDRIVGDREFSTHFLVNQFDVACSVCDRL